MTEPLLLTTESVLDFGKYKGKKVDFVAKNDPGYLVWMSENITRFVIEDEVLEAAIDDEMEKSSTYESEWDVTGAGDQ